MALPYVLMHVANALSSIALSFGCISCSMTKWMAGDVTLGIVDVYVESGIWSACTTIKATDAETCSSINFDGTDDDYERNIKAMRALMILGILCMASAIIIFILVSCVLQKRQSLFFAASGCAFFGGLYYMISMAIFVDQLKQSAYDYHASFYLDIFAWLFAWTASGLFAAAKVLMKK